MQQQSNRDVKNEEPAFSMMDSVENPKQPDSFFEGGEPLWDSVDREEPEEKQQSVLMPKSMVPAGMQRPKQGTKREMRQEKESFMDGHKSIMKRFKAEDNEKMEERSILGGSMVRIKTEGGLAKKKHTRYYEVPYADS